MTDHRSELADEITEKATTVVRGLPTESGADQVAAAAIAVTLRVLAVRGWHLVPYLGFGAKKGYLGKLADVIEGGALLAREFGGDQS